MPAPSASITGFTDTTLSGYYRWRVSGTESGSASTSTCPPASRASRRETSAIQDEDLVALQRFGEGFDVNPT